MPDGAYIGHLMVLVDGTAPSLRAADLALDLARLIDADVVALAVVETETLEQLLQVRILAPGEMKDFEAELAHHLRRTLDEVAGRARGKSVPVECVLAAGNSETVVPREIAARDIGMLVIGAFEGSRALRDVVARQRQQIVDRAPCHVLVAK